MGHGAPSLPPRLPSTGFQRMTSTPAFQGPVWRKGLCRVWLEWPGHTHTRTWAPGWARPGAREDRQLAPRAGAWGQGWTTPVPRHPGARTPTLGAPCPAAPCAPPRPLPAATAPLCLGWPSPRVLVPCCLGAWERACCEPVLDPHNGTRGAPKSHGCNEGGVRGTSPGGSPSITRAPDASGGAPSQCPPPHLHLFPSSHHPQPSQDPRGLGLLPEGGWGCGAGPAGRTRQSRELAPLSSRVC